ncbi:MAG TPA: glycosyltransferase [Solirubrobacteraceae bacterium]|nr:glycosyltransferase [Solirubrobacteraceae bacterium]
MSTCAAVVTHNRRALLAECLAALAAQDRPVDAVIVVDNASTDGTAQWLAAEHPDVRVVRSEENLGGAGGFALAVERAVATGHEWVWMLDDDTVPRPDAHRRLLDAAAVSERAGERPAVMASRVEWDDGRPHPMNVPGPDARRASRHPGLEPIRYASFVSILVRREAVERHGLPLGDYFLWLDDVEFTGRLLRDEPGYLVPASVAHHRTPDPYRPLERPQRFYYAVRNRLFMLRSPAWQPRERYGWARNLVWETKRFLEHHDHGREAWTVVLRGLRDGLRRAPARTWPAR